MSKLDLKSDILPFMIAPASRVKALLALNFAEVDVSDDVYRRVVDMEGSTHAQITSPESQKSE